MVCIEINLKLKPNQAGLIRQAFVIMADKWPFFSKCNKQA